MSAANLAASLGLDGLKEDELKVLATLVEETERNESPRRLPSKLCLLTRDDSSLWLKLRLVRLESVKSVESVESGSP